MMLEYRPLFRLEIQITHKILPQKAYLSEQKMGKLVGSTVEHHNLAYHSME